MKAGCDEPADASASRNDAESSRRDAGVTFVELLVTIVLLGTIVLTVLAAVRANTIASSVSRSAARAESAVVNIADRINRAPKSCNYTIYAQAAVLTEQWPPGSVQIQQWHYDYDGYSDQPVTDADWLPGARAVELTEPPDLLVQKVAITVTTPDGRVTRTIELVKSDV